MATLHLIHGFVGAGKTTFAKKLESEIAAIRFTHDEWMVKLYGHNPPEAKYAQYYQKVSELIWDLTIKLLYLDCDVILDFGFWTRASRDEARAEARKTNSIVKLYFISCSEKAVLHRVATRNRNLPQESLYIDLQALASFRLRFESLKEDEPFILVQTDLEDSLTEAESSGKI